MSDGPAELALRCEWGEAGVQLLAPASDAVVIVDVLSFSTCVEVAASRGADVYPWRWRAASAGDFAALVGAELAGPRGRARYSLSPVSLLALEPGARLVLPSPNGSTLSLATGDTPTFCGCLRNARAVARAARALGPRVAVIPAGERWPDGTLRPCLEDWLGAGAVLARLLEGAAAPPEAVATPEARSAFEAFRAAEGDLEARLLDCTSGRELCERGFAADVTLSAALDVSPCAPRLRERCYRSD